MSLLYSVFSRLVYWLLYPYARWRANGGSRKWRDRLGLILPGRADIWMHAASVGEVKVISTLVAYLLDARPGLRIHLTVMTPQGVASAEQLLGNRATISFFPMDVTPVMRRALIALSPRMIVVAETEIWPNLIREASRGGVPMVLVNGRMSEGSFGKYRLVKGAMRSLLSRYDRLLLKSEEDRERIAPFVADPERIEVAGDMKFDAPLQEKSATRVNRLRRELSVAPGQFLLVAGSTRPGEEVLLLEIYRRVRAEYSNLRLLLAPRHLDRLEEIEALVAAEGLVSHRYGTVTESAAAPESFDSDVILVDRMGVLNDLYLAADLAFVGGTLVNIGGHNLLEPVWARTPVLFGPHTENVRDAAEYIKQHDYGMEVDSSDQFADLLGEIMNGDRCFAHKADTDDLTSATAIACTYILERMTDA